MDFATEDCSSVVVDHGQQQQQQILMKFLRWLASYHQLWLDPIVFNIMIEPSCLHSCIIDPSIKMAKRKNQWREEYVEIPLCSYKVYHKEGGNVAHILYSLSCTAHLLYYLPSYLRARRAKFGWLNQLSLALNDSSCHAEQIWTLGPLQSA